MSTPPSTAPPDQDILIGQGARFLNAMLDSADPDLLGKDYWTRARSALEAAAATAAFSEAVSKAAAKLQITWALTAESGDAIGVLAGSIGGAGFGAWAEVCRRDAVYVTAIARIWRDERKEAARAARTGGPE